MKRPKEYWLEQKWGSLQLDPHQELPDTWGVSSHKKFFFTCGCTRRVLMQMYHMGTTQTCGRCKWNSREYWINQVWGKLTLDPSQELPSEWGATVKTKFLFNCDCGRQIPIGMGNVTNGHYKSCGKCSFQPREHWLSRMWGKLTLDPNQELPDEWGPSSSQLTLYFLCQCGHRVRMAMATVGTNSRSCGMCNWKSKEFWLSQTWGTMRLDPNQELPDEWGKTSNKDFKFNCSGCGESHYISMNNVVRGGNYQRCLYKTKEYWLTQTWGKLTLDPNQELPDGGWSSGSARRFYFNCACSNRLDMHFYNATKCQSCGCLRWGENEFSPETRIRDFVRSLASDTYPASYPIEGGRTKYDIYIPSQALAIEYHGLPWHSEQFCGSGNGKKDFRKFDIARSNGTRLIQIYSDEWESKQEIFKAMLRDLIAPGPKIRVNPKFELITGRTPTEAKNFLNQNHYLGAASGCVTIIARHREAIVGAWVFMKRETGVVLWHRACWDRKYKSWNPHEKALKLALPALREMGFTRMVTFSDNRFHTGNLYEKLGFTFEEEIPPEYSYTNNKSRKSKFALRVPAGVNEVEEARAQGWHRIWDSGKRRYSLPI